MSTFKYYKNGQWNYVNGAITGDTLPIGAIIPYGSLTAPANWLICDGSAVSRTTYVELFNAIGTTFGSGDGSTTFNLPNLQGKIPVGQDATQTEFDTMGTIGGSKAMQQHYHEGAYSTNGGELTVYGGSGSTQIIDLQSGYSASGSVNAKIMTADAGTGNSGNLQPYQVVCYIIKAKQSSGFVGSVSNTYSTSQSDTYSCDYINGIIESGSNTNGEYVKYADGTMICTGAKSGTTTWEDWWSFCKRSPEGNNMLFASFPQAFINGNARVSITTSHGNAVFSASYNSVQTDGFYFICYKPSTNTSTNYGIQYIAIGRWK